MLFINRSAIRRMLWGHRSAKAIILLSGLLFWWSYRSVSTVCHEAEDEETLLKYQPPVQSGVPLTGRRLEVERTYRIRKLQNYVAMTTDVARDFVVATAASEHFYLGGLEALSNVQQLLPGHPLIFYDLEETSGDSSFIANQINAICGVTYRSFNFGQYPPHVRKLNYYAWKPLIIYELLREFPGVLWIDSSIRFVTSNLTRIFDKVIRTDGVLTLTSTGHSNFAVTHPQMYVFLPTSDPGMIRTEQHEANSVLLYRTRTAFVNVVYWWAMCALDPLCIAPTDRTGCVNPYHSPRVYADCHRFDQSALNILLANYFAFDYLEYIGSEKVLEVHRYRDGNRNIQVCLSGKAPENADIDSFVLRAPVSSANTHDALQLPFNVTRKSLKMPVEYGGRAARAKAIES